MASSFIDFNDLGFWARDGFVEAMQICLINEIENQRLDTIEWINNYKTELALQSLPMIFGGMSMLLEEFLTTNERKSQIVKLIDKIIHIIDSTNDYTGSNLHSMRNRAMTILLETNQITIKNQEEFDRIVHDSGWYASDGIAEVKDRYQHSFKLLKRLINGELNTTASSPENYWNY
ncbi:hypothetical protein [Flavobacterium hibisci]|uniref:hypothetical protein n=1 Tax=Flavobacterium hibisci TaxID=1914462 RepID=UPI001CBABE45|nr:hypothetical protein [Flavobacterium hibisci]MBZ4041237.1 hypothetical protein [Flavobacterium hibisci]